MFMIMNEFKVAFEKAQQINEILSSKGGAGKFVPLEEIIAAVQKASGCAEISVDRRSFSELKLPDSTASKYGAMLSTGTREVPGANKKEKIAYLIINADNNADMQRFSVVHELGHLITEVPNFVYEQTDDGLFTISAHINPDITFLSEDEYRENDYMIAEQVANIFALLVLIPKDLKIRDIREEGLERLSNRYGVTEDAICSRVLLSAVSKA